MKIVASVLIGTIVITYSVIGVVDVGDKQPGVERIGTTDGGVVIGEDGYTQTRIVGSKNADGKDGNSGDNSGNEGNNGEEQVAGGEGTAAGIIVDGVPSPHNVATLRFSGSDCDCGHVNPDSISVVGLSSGQNGTWTITNQRSGKVVYSGEGNVVSSEPRTLLKKKLDDKYKFEFMYEDKSGNDVYLSRVFQIYSGKIDKNQFE